MSRHGALCTFKNVFFANLCPVYSCKHVCLPIFDILIFFLLICLSYAVLSLGVVDVQVEFASVVVINKSDMLVDTKSKLSDIVSVIRGLNPGAQLMSCCWGEVDMEYLINTNRCGVVVRIIVIGIQTKSCFFESMTNEVNICAVDTNRWGVLWTTAGYCGDADCCKGVEWFTQSVQNIPKQYFAAVARTASSCCEILLSRSGHSKATSSSVLRGFGFRVLIVSTD